MKFKIILIVIGVVAATLIVWKVTRGAAAQSLPDTVVQTASVKETNLPQRVEAIGSITATTIDISSEAAGHIAAIDFADGAAVKKGDVLIQLDDSLLKTKILSTTAQYQYSKASFERLHKLSKNIVPQQSIDQAETEMKQNQAAMQEADVLISKMKLSAPFDGVVGQRKVNVGDYVNVGQSVVTLTDTSHLRVEYHLPEKYLPDLKLGQTVELTTAAYPDKTFKGVIAYISPTIDTNSRTISLYANLDNSEATLAAGMFVNIRQTLGVTKNALLVPARSLVPGLSGNQIFKVVDGKAISSDVQVGLRTNQMVEITQGLSAQDVVITDGQLKVQNGQPVTVHQS